MLLTATLPKLFQYFFAAACSVGCLLINQHGQLLLMLLLVRQLWNTPLILAFIAPLPLTMTLLLLLKAPAQPPILRLTPCPKVPAHLPINVAVTITAFVNSTYTTIRCGRSLLLRRIMLADLLPVFARSPASILTCIYGPAAPLLAMPLHSMLAPLLSLLIFPITPLLLVPC
jgi:hypothetical protein